MRGGGGGGLLQIMRVRGERGAVSFSGSILKLNNESKHQYIHTKRN